jgi:hypothetical protein
MQPDQQTDLAFLTHLGQHLVAMCGSYSSVNDQGKPTGPARFYSYTGTVFEILGKWCIATAGHCLKSLDNAVADPKVLVEAQVLMDYFGPNVRNKMPLPFKPLEQGFIYVDDDGLDFGFVVLSDLWRQNLACNGIVPFTSKQWHFPADHEFESYGIVGCPDEYTGGVPSFDMESMLGYVRPVFVPLRRLPDDTKQTFPRFRGEIVYKGTQERIEGMSGGPIFGFFREADDVKYLVVALQSRWDRRSIVLGCLIPNMMRCVEQKLREYVAQSQCLSPSA